MIILFVNTQALFNFPSVTQTPTFAGSGSICPLPALVKIVSPFSF